MMRGAQIAAVATSLAWLAAAQNAPGGAVNTTAPYPMNNSSTIATSTTAAAPAPTATELKCPESNNTEYIAPSGARFLIECELDHFGGDMAMESASSFQQCIDFCDARAGCVDVSYQGSACYMKATVGRPIYSKTVLGARLISPPAGAPEVPICPVSDGTNYTTLSNKTFVIECGVDYPSGRNEDNLAVISMDRGNEPGTLWFQRCIETCDATFECVDASLSGSACYLKRSVDQARRTNNADIFGARLINPAPPTPAPSTSAPQNTPTQSTTPVAPPAPTSTAVTCPAANGTTYYATSGEVRKAFVIECGVDYASSVRDVIGGPNNLPGTSGELWLSQCIDICANTTNCVNIALSGAACYLKSNITGSARIPQRPEFGGAVLVSSPIDSTSVAPSPTPAVPTPANPPPAATTTPAVCSLQTSPQCPACNGRTIYIEDEDRGVPYRVQCGIEYIGGNVGSPLSGFTGARGYRRCVESCFYAEGCAAVAYSGSMCQLKSAVSGGTRANATIWGAVDLDVLVA